MTNERNPTVIEGISDEALVSEAKNSLYQYFRTNDPNLLKRAQVAQGTLGSISRMRATENAADALAFHMARSLTSDVKQLAEYIRVTQPHSPIVKALPKGGE